MAPRNLAIARAGDDSKHEGWLSDPAKKNFDLLVAYYGNTPGRFKDRAEIYHCQKGLKYPWFNAYLEGNPVVLEYDAVWLADDDIETDTARVSEMFDIFHEYRLGLAQPALTLKSCYSYPVLRVKRGCLLRFTEFVEEQQPVFSRDVLRLVRPTLGLNVSGWGLGILWPELMGYPKDKIAVIDATPVGHYRCQQSGPMYKEILPSMGISARDELNKIQNVHGYYRSESVLSEVLLDPLHPLTKLRLERQKI